MISSYCVMVGVLLRSMSFGPSSPAYKMTVKIFIPSQKRAEREICKE